MRTAAFLILLCLPVFGSGLTVDNVETAKGIVEIRLSLKDYSLYNYDNGKTGISVGNCGYRGENGAPSLVGRLFFVAIPKGVIPEVELEVLNWSDWRDVSPAPVPQRTGKEVSYNADPAEYSVARPARAEYVTSADMRGVHIAVVEYIPVEYDPSRGVRFALAANLRVNYGSRDFDYDTKLCSPVYHRILSRILVNPRDVLPAEPIYMDGPWHSSQGAELLIITPPAFESNLGNWPIWKVMSGIPTKIVTTVETGTSRINIKSYIRDAYETWELPPSYALFIGDTDFLPTFEFGPEGLGDGPYGCLEGADYFPEVLTGRLSCDNTSELDVLIRKCINFEYMPDTTDDWYIRAVGVVNEDDPYLPLGPDDSSYAAAVIYAMEQCSLAGFTSHPVFRNLLGHVAADVYPYIDAGCAFETYRGQAYPDWYIPFQGLYDLNTGRKCPVTVSITCITGAFQSGDNHLCERSTRAGTVGSPRGSVAWIGQATVSSNTPERSSLSKHIFEGFFPASLNELSAAHLYGKIEMLAEFGPTYAAEGELTTTTLVGSPEMRAWTAPIGVPDVDYLPMFIPESPYFDVTVTVGGESKFGARVALNQDTLMSYAITDSFGNASVEFYPIMDPLVPIVLVVSGANIYPHIDTLELTLPGVLIWPAPVEFTEISGNGDDFINPGETHSFVPKIVNLGSDTAMGLEGLMITPWDFVWADTTSTFPDIATFDTVSGSVIEFDVPVDYEANDSLVFEMYINDHPDGPWFIKFPTFPGLHRFNLQVDSIEIVDNAPYGNDNDRIDPGETVSICVQMINPGYGVCESLLTLFSVSNDSIKIMSGGAKHGYWGTLAKDFLYPCFCIDVSPELDYEPSREFDLLIDADCNTYEYHDTLLISFEFGSGSTEFTPWLYRYSEPEFQDLGDGDGIIEPGERVGIIFQTKNGGSMDASGVHAGVSATPFVYSDGHASLVGDIPAGSIVENTYDAITCTTANYTPEDTVLEVPIILLDSGSSYSHTVKVYLRLGSVADISEGKRLPSKIAIGRFRPNPFNSSGEFEIFLPEKQDRIIVEAYDILGNLVEVIHDGELSRGTHKILFNPAPPVSGIYLIRIKTGEYEASFKALLLK